jgi:hypothetical protein
MNDSKMPFLTRFVQAIPASEPAERRYDPARQEGFVRGAGGWGAALDAVDGSGPQTKITKVDRETTDDE